MTASATTIAARLESIAGVEQVHAQSAACMRYAVDDLAPSAVVRPANAEQVAEVVRFAVAEKLAVIPCGARTKLGIGMPPARYDIALDTTRLDQIAHYDPGDLTLSVDAGMPLAKLNAVLGEHAQFLPLLAPWYSRTTVGGTIASGVDSPLRQFYGTARDFVIGAEFVTGAGTLAKSGGRVVKNVTGYDLHKLLIGSLGTLAVITRVNFRTFPAPPAARGFVASFATAEEALRLRRRVVDSPLSPLTLDVLSPGLAQIFATRTPATPEVAVFPGESHSSNQTLLRMLGNWFSPREWHLCAGFAGTPEVLQRYERDLTQFAADSRATCTTVLDDATRPSVWGRLRESLSMLCEASPAATIFKLSLLPEQHTAAFAKLDEIAERASLPSALIARAAGTIYFGLLPEQSVEKNAENLARLASAATTIFDLAAHEGGYATIPFCPSGLKRRLNIWGTHFVSRMNLRDAHRPDFALMQRVKSAFDPNSILAPARFPGAI